VLQDTFVIVLGDNGTSWKAVPQPAPQKYKATVFEGGVNVPLLVIGPGVATGEATGLVSSIDIFQTVIDLASRGRVEPATDSVSLLPYLRAPAIHGSRPWVFTELFDQNGFGPYQEVRRAIRNQRYKLIRRSGPSLVLFPKVDFYDLLADPLEKQNLVPLGLTAEEQVVFDTLDGVLSGLQ
jgi:arylsulfatase A-like enzyme